MLLEIQIDGEWLACGTLEHDSIDGHPAYRGHWRNDGGMTVKLGGFRFSGIGFDEVPGRYVRCYSEGWSATSVAASSQYGDRNFHYNPEYLPFAVSDVSCHDSETPNRFASDTLIVLNDTRNGENLLAGFVTSADQFTSFRLDLKEDGLEFCGYSHTDNIAVAPGESVSSEVLTVLRGASPHALLDTFADLWAEQMQARPGQTVPRGWCSWYYYFGEVTAEDVMENVQYAATRRDEYPLEYFQIDEGYEPAMGDWLLPSPRFPAGVGDTLHRIAAAGFKPGLWLAPFMVQKTSRLFHDHPEWMIRNAAGEILFPVEWAGIPVAILDCTLDEVCNYLKDLCMQIRGYGCEYVKLDFLMYACSVPGGVYANPAITRARALRRGLQAIRDGLGDRVFLLGCTSPLGPAPGLVDGFRVSTDITPRWGRKEQREFAEAPSVPNVCRNIINRRYLHRKLWLNDPDVLIARTDQNELTENEIILWTTALWLVGGLVMLCDRFSTLDPSRANLAKMLLRQTDSFRVRPLDLLERRNPALWYGQSTAGEPVLGIFNFEESRQTFDIDFNELFGDNVVVREFWSGELCGGPLITVAPHSCKLLVPTAFHGIRP